MRRLLVVVDMQNDFIDGSLGTKEAREIVPAVVRKIEEYEAGGDEVVYTMDTHDEEYMNTQEGHNLPVPHCLKGSGGWQLWPEIGKHPGKRFEKPAFGSLELAEYVAEAVAGGCESVELVGVCTDICVISNAMIIKARVPELLVEVDGHCCAGVTPESHGNALEAMKMCQISVHL